MLNLLDVYDGELILNCLDVDVVDDVTEFLRADGHDMDVDVLDEAVAEEVGVNDVGNDVFPFDVMRLAGSTS